MSINIDRDGIATLDDNEDLAGVTPRPTRAARLQQAMNLRGVHTNELDRKAFGKASGWTSRFLTGKKIRPGVDSIEQVCKVLRINPEWLMHGRGDMEATERPSINPATIAPLLHPDIEAVMRLARNRKQWPLAALFMADELVREKPISPEQLEALLDDMEKELRRVKAAHMK